MGEKKAKKKAQVWIERVGDGAECSIVIEHGVVSEDRTKPTDEVA